MDPTAIARSRNRSSRRLRNKQSSAGEVFGTPPQSPMVEEDSSSAIMQENVSDSTPKTSGHKVINASELQQRIAAERERLATKKERLVKSRSERQSSLFAADPTPRAKEAAPNVVTPPRTRRDSDDQMDDRDDELLASPLRPQMSDGSFLSATQPSDSFLSLTPGSTPVMSPRQHDNDEAFLPMNEDAFGNPLPNHNHESMSLMQLEENSDGWIDARSSQPQREPSSHMSPHSADAFIDAQSQHSNMNSVDLKVFDVRASQMSQHRNAVTSTKVQPLSTKKRHKRQATPCFKVRDSQKCWKLIGLLALLLLLIGFITATVIAVQESNKNNANTAPSPSPTITPEPCQLETNILSECVCRAEIPDDGTIGEEVLFNRDLVLDFLQQSGIAIDDNDNNPLSCHVTNQALLYVSDLNHHVATPPTNLAIFQRYVLAVLFQELHGNDWNVSKHWLASNSSECFWFGIICSDASQRMIGIELADNNMIGTMPTGLLELIESLRSIELQDNPQLQGDGVVSNIVTTLPLLEHLDISRTQLGGTLPLNDWSSPHWVEFHASESQLSGLLPWWTSTPLTQLRVLDLSHNALTGPLPSSLESWTQLSVFRVSDNQLTGTLPTSLPSLLTTFLVNDNAGLTGTLPSPLSSPLLAFIDISGTSITESESSLLSYCTNLPYLDSLVVSCGPNTIDITTCPCCTCDDNDDNDVVV